jgi:hypothetical protein
MAEKGELLEIGLQGRLYETKKGIIWLNITFLLIIIISFLMALLSLVGVDLSIGTIDIWFLVFSFYGFLMILIVLFFDGQEIDGIYEYGLTHRRVGIIKKIQNKHWIPWNEVERIYYGIFDFEDHRGKSEYLKVYSGNKKGGFFIKVTYNKKSPKFYPLLMQMLKEKSTQAQWIQKNE